MSVDRDEVRRIAELAKLSLDDSETDRLAEEMTRILGHAERLRGVGSGTVADARDRADPEDGSDLDHGPDLDHGSAGLMASTGGTGTPLVSRTAEGAQPGSGAAPDAGDPAVPDPLARDLTDFAPEMHDGFFTVPPPPGVSAEES